MDSYHSTKPPTYHLDNILYEISILVNQLETGPHYPFYRTQCQSIRHHMSMFRNQPTFSSLQHYYINPLEGRHSYQSGHPQPYNISEQHSYQQVFHQPFGREIRQNSCDTKEEEAQIELFQQEILEEQFRVNHPELFDPYVSEEDFRNMDEIDKYIEEQDRANTDFADESFQDKECKSMGETNKHIEEKTQKGIDNLDKFIKEQYIKEINDPDKSIEKKDKSEKIDEETGWASIVGRKRYCEPDNDHTSLSYDFSSPRSFGSYTSLVNDAICMMGGILDDDNDDTIFDSGDV